MKTSRLLNVIFDKIGGSYGRPVRVPCRIISRETSRGRDSFSDTELQKRAGGKGWGLPGPWVPPAAVPGWPFNLIPSQSHRLKTDKMWETVTAPSALLNPPHQFTGFRRWQLLPDNNNYFFFSFLFLYILPPLNPCGWRWTLVLLIFTPNPVTHEGSGRQVGGRKDDDHKNGTVL